MSLQDAPLVIVVMYIFVVTFFLIYGCLFEVILDNESRVNTMNKNKKDMCPSFSYLRSVDQVLSLAELSKPCSICLIALLDPGDPDMVLRTPCGHYFHGKCIESWAMQAQSCPLCRTSLMCAFDEDEVDTESHAPAERHWWYYDGRLLDLDEDDDAPPPLPHFNQNYIV